MLTVLFVGWLAFCLCLVLSNDIDTLILTQLLPQHTQDTHIYISYSLRNQQTPRTTSTSPHHSPLLAHTQLREASSEKRPKNPTAMNNIDIGRYKRIVQYFWDPEPKNDEGPGSRLWCLGSQYVTQDEDFVLLDTAAAITNETATKTTTTTTTSQASTETQQTENQTSPDEPSTDTQSSTSNPPPAGKKPDTLGWPKAFLDDFESKVWMTYRSNFPTIAKSEDQNASQTMSLGVRLRSHLIEGFTSDTGWGCMIRSGQSLLANAILVSQLGRGMTYLLDLYTDLFSQY